MKTTAQRPPSRSVPDEAQLADSGFTSEQIMRLTELRAVYPLLEYVDSTAVVNRLRFLKWRYSTGQIDS
jgi:hypothetical protein